MIEPLKLQIEINAEPKLVWNALTNIAQMKQWMGEAELQLEIETSWEIGSPFIIKGFHHVQFENRGTVIAFKPFEKLIYSHLSSVSNLADQPENYTVYAFDLKDLGDQTLLSFTAENFPTETIFKHLELYWRVTVVILKETVENSKLLNGVS